MGNKNIDKVFSRENDYEKARNTKLSRKKSKSKKRVIGIIAIALAALTAGTVFVTSIFKKNKNNNQNKSGEKQNTVQTTNDTLPAMNTLSLDKLGIELEFPKEENKNKEYKNPSENVDPKEIVEDTNGTIWANEEAYNNSDQVGKEVIDYKDGSLESNSNGTVYEKETGYEIQDSNGNVETGNINDDGSVGEFVWDEDRGEMVNKDELGKYIYSDLNFYFEDGSLAIAKGDLVSKEDYNRAKKELFTTKPSNSVPETTYETEYNTAESEIETSYTDEGVINSDGTYTIYGSTYMDKATFEAFILDDNSSINFGYVDGVIYPQSYIDEMNKQITLVK